MGEVMAEVPNSRSVPSGHDEQFINPPGEDLHCIICFLPSKEPVLTRCDHKFCGQCLEEYILDSREKIANRYMENLKQASAEI